MVSKPTKVQMLGTGSSVEFEMTNSVRRLSDRGYKRNAKAARIHGPKGAAATFYDDSHFRTGENYVYVEKKTAGPVDVPIAKNFVKTKEQAPAGIFRGEEHGYKWILFKNPKQRMWNKWLNPILDAIDGTIGWDKIVAQAEKSNDPRVVFGGKVVGYLAPMGRKSSNYRVDNCSSVRLGPLPKP